MIRFPTPLLNHEMAAGMAQGRARLDDAGAEVASERRAQRLSEMADDLRSYLNADARAERASAHADALKAGETRLTIVDAQLDHLQAAVAAFRGEIEAVLAADQNPGGLAAAAEALLTTLGTVADTRIGEDRLFAPGAAGPVLRAKTLGELASLGTPDAGFAPMMAGGSINLGDGASVSIDLPVSLFGRDIVAALMQFETAGIGVGGLDSGARAALNAVLDTLKAGAGAITHARAITGQRLSAIEAATGGQSRKADAHRAVAGALGDADMAAAIARLQNEQALMQASYRSLMVLRSMNLNDFI